MPSASFELAFTDGADVPAMDAPDHVLVRWLRQRLGRPPSWLEVLALRAGLRERARRLVRWAWWRRLRRPVPPRRDDLVAGFLRSWEGQTLFRLLGGMAALLAQLALPDPWEGFDGRHPTARRLNRREALRERLARGCSVPLRERAAAAVAYAEWKLSGQPEVAPGCIPEAVEFLAPAHAAAINAMTGTAAIGICARLRRVGAGEAERRALLRELDRVGGEALQRWPDVGGHQPGAPLGVWPPPEGECFSASSAPVPPSPPGFSR
ncbi:hypothetical protein [Roseomonas sp. 18066]|uniref:hypothetical protein n=1 Tax=Roseomonas sp. 18066 TaxID=2681412 RepID=UPI001357A06E|nr:hypothetical protein [Roseomonas sp. 18066]